MDIIIFINEVKSMIKKLILGTILLAICHLSISTQDITFSLSERKVPDSTTKTEKIIFQPNISPTKEISSTIFKENTDYTGWLYSYHQLWEQLPFSITQGPRYLHSLGQLHKGGPNNGLFIIISQVNQDLFAKEKSFKNLLLAQSYGDFQALNENGRKAILINLPPEVSLKDFLRSVE